VSIGAVTVREVIDTRVRSPARRGPAGSVGATILICVLAVLYPIHTAAIADINLSAGDAVVGPLLLGLAWRFVRGPVPLPRYMPHVLTLSVVIVTSVIVNALTWTVYYELDAGVIEAIKFVAVAAWMVAIFALLRPQLARRFTQFAVASATVAALWSLRTVIENVILGVQRPTGPYENPNIYGNYLVLNAFLTLGAAKVLAEDSAGQALGGLAWLRKRRSLLMIVLLPTIILGMMSTGSRGSMLSFAAGMIACPRLWFPKRITIRMVTTAALGFALLGAGIGWFLNQHPYMLKRVERTGAGEQNVDERLRLWRAARAAFVERPVLGIGYGEFPRYADYQHHLPGKVAHQMYLSMAAELGALGFLAFIWLLLTGLWDGWRIRTPIRGAIASCGFSCLVAASLHGFFANVEQFRTLWIALGIVAAVVAAREPTGFGDPVRPLPSGRSSWRARLAIRPRVRGAVPR
jgi:putative inorganic carbon (HCO3(-)) transporter